LYQSVGLKPKSLKLVETDQTRRWIQRLDDVGGFSESAVLKKKVISILEKADEDSGFRTIFNFTIENATATCGDRMALSLLKLDINYQLSIVDIKDVASVAKVLIRGVWTLDLLESIARDKIDILKVEGKHVDDIEVYLAYPIKLRDALKIPITLGEMLFFNVSDVTESDLDEAKEKIMKLRSSLDLMSEFLITQELWQKTQEENYPKESEMIETRKSFILLKEMNKCTNLNYWFGNKTIDPTKPRNVKKNVKLRKNKFTIETFDFDFQLHPNIKVQYNPAIESYKGLDFNFNPNQNFIIQSNITSLTVENFNGTFFLPFLTTFNDNREITTKSVFPSLNYFVLNGGTVGNVVLDIDVVKLIDIKDEEIKIECERGLDSIVIRDCMNLKKIYLGKYKNNAFGQTVRKCPVLVNIFTTDPESVHLMRYEIADCPLLTSLPNICNEVEIFSITNLIITTLDDLIASWNLSVFKKVQIRDCRNLILTISQVHTLINNNSRNNWINWIFGNVSSVAGAYLRRRGLTENRQFVINHDYIDDNDYDDITNEIRVETEQTKERIKNLYQSVRLTPKPLKLVETEQTRRWILRLNDVGGFDKSDVLKKKVISILEKANEDSNFRNVFNFTIENATATCGDRMALSLLKLDINYQLSIVDIKDVASVAKVLIRGVWTLDLLESIARDKIDILQVEGKHVDDIEVYLAYPIKLRDALKIPITLGQMLYFNVSDVTDSDLKEAKEKIMKLRSSLDLMSEFLITQELWQKTQEANYPNESEMIEDLKEEAIETDNYDKLHRAQINFAKIVLLESKPRSELTETALQMLNDFRRNL
jgi:hypothetical protein